MLVIRHVSNIGYEECPCGICQQLIKQLLENNQSWRGSEIVIQIKKVTRENNTWLYE